MTYDQVHTMNRAAAKVREKRNALKAAREVLDKAERALNDARVAEIQAAEEFYATCATLLEPSRPS